MAGRDECPIVCTGRVSPTFIDLVNEYCLTKSMTRKTSPADLAGRIKQVMEFDRFYSRRLREAARSMCVNEVNAAELGIFLELLRAPCPSDWLRWRLDLDPGYLSRTLAQLELMGFISTCASDADRRIRQVTLTGRGRAAARSLEGFQEDAVRKALEEFPVRQQRRLVRSMNAIVAIFEQDPVARLRARFSGR
jgi:DNA-binding MarR family transcriptional regulator